MRSEFVKAIEELKRDKSPGMDDIPIGILRKLWKRHRVYYIWNDWENILEWQHFRRFYPKQDYPNTQKREIPQYATIIEQ